MRTFLQRSNRFLEIPLDLGPRLLLLAAAAVLATSLTQPLWSMTMFAPQYPGGLRLQINTSGLEGANAGQDLKEINLLNHYIGMRDLSNDDFTEFVWMPFAIGGLALLFLRAAAHGTMATLVDAFVLFGYFALFSLWSFAYKLYLYGHNLSPSAPVKVDPFTPPLFGYQQIANFEVYSYPAAGSYFMAGTAVLLLVALAAAWRSSRAAAVDAHLPGVPARARTGG